MSSNSFFKTSRVAVQPVVKIKYAPQLELMAVEATPITMPKVEAAPPFD